MDQQEPRNTYEWHPSLWVLPGAYGTYGTYTACGTDDGLWMGGWGGCGRVHAKHTRQLVSYGTYGTYTAGGTSGTDDGLWMGG